MDDLDHKFHLGQATVSTFISSVRSEAIKYDNIPLKSGGADQSRYETTKEQCSFKLITLHLVGAGGSNLEVNYLNMLKRDNITL